MRPSCRRTGTPSAEAAEAIGGLCLRGRSALSLSLKRRRHDRHGSETSAGLPRARGNACSSCRHCDRPMRAKAKTRAIVRAGPADARRWRVDGRLRSRSARSAHAARSPPGCSTDDGIAVCGRPVWSARSSPALRAHVATRRSRGVVCRGSGVPPSQGGATFRAGDVTNSEAVRFRRGLAHSGRGGD
jgi:hypothetical protein